ncbi:MAG TPA: DUF6492 family protein [Beijerinckiaceae bacterium]|nr:DUF6492 family protein [Beijerinckiaceae bacterium]
MSDKPYSAGIVTCSYSGDYDACRILCESIDRFVPAAMAHTLYVPRADVPMFAHLGNARRRIATQEELLPGWFWKLPLPSPEWRARLLLPRRNVYLTPFSLPVRGWIAQQVMKLAATQRAETDIVVNIDSDNAFIRPLTMDHLVRDGRVRFYRNPDKVPLESHRRWHRAAGKLLGLPDSDFYGAEYIHPLVVWRRDVLRAMLDRIVEVTGMDWQKALARTTHFAEFVLYGVYADKVAGLDQAGLWASDQPFCLSRWAEDFRSAADEVAFVNELQPRHVTCLIQSTIPMPPNERQRIFNLATDAAAAMDRAG